MRKLAYPLKHWITSLAIGPLLGIVYDDFSNPQLVKDELGIYFLFVAFGLLLSIPVFVLYVLVFNKLTRTVKSTLAIKAILNVVAIIGVVATFSLIKGTSTAMASIFYSAGLIIASTFYRVTTEIEGQPVES